MTNDSWIKDHTFHHEQFADLDALVAEKEKQGLKISLCLPALNEESTIGKEVVIFRSELMTRHPLIDELAVIDSGSTDQTREIAESFGADVYLSSDILPETGTRCGKGENLWKAIYQLKGDIIVYVDSDIRNIHARFAYGLIAPLLYRPEIRYVKGFYERPLVHAGGARTSGGGRVTEILVRPLFSLFFPDLTHVIQPLSGEYAVRRDVLEAIPFPTGYGVETSHLIDVLCSWGLDAIGQTDLGARVHYNQPTVALGKMSFGILKAFLRRAEGLDIIKELPQFDDIFFQFEHKDDEYRRIEFDIPEDERPPMLEIPAYRKLRGLDT
jgi:glucosyl-3-phosphoglycerate synthase